MYKNIIKTVDNNSYMMYNTQKPRRNSMNWETVKIYGEQKGRNTPYASIGRGKISLSAAASELIENNEKYNYVKLLKATQNQKVYIGIKFFTEYVADSIKIKRKEIKGKRIAGMTIENKSVIEDLFGADGIQKGTTRYSVKLDDDDKDILVIFKE